MDKIKSILHPHGSREDRDHAGPVTPDTHPAASTAGQTHVGTDGPIGSTGQHSVPAVSDQHSTPALSNNNSRPGNTPLSKGNFDGNSEASIKSGIIGFPPGGQGGHAALPNNNAAERSLRPDQIVGGGTAGSGTLPPISHQPYATSSTQSHAADTGRSFPLSGGVISQHSTDNTSVPHGLTTSARQPGTKENEIGTHDTSGRAPLAGAAAAAAAVSSSALSSHPESRGVQTLGDNARSSTAQTTPQSHHPEALAAATAPASNISTHSSAHEPGHSSNSGTLLDHDKASGTSSGIEHTGLLSYRPQTHRTDTQPHIPGEFPGPTPAEELSEPSFSHSNVDSAHGLRHTGTLDDPQSRSADHPSGHPSEHHAGRDAALAGGVGAAGLGAYAASQKHETPAANLYDDKSPYSSTTLDPRVTGGAASLDNQRFDPQARTEPSPSSSSALGTSVLNPSSKSPVTQPEPDREHHYGRDAALVGGGAAAAGGLYAASQRDKPDTTPAVPIAQNTSNVPTTGYTSQIPTTQGASSVPTVGHTSQIPIAQHGLEPASSGATIVPIPEATSASSQLKSNDPQHHYGRDATLAGTGAATAGSAYYASQHNDKPNTGPASETIGPHKSNIANILDPRVKPDPELQSSKAHDKAEHQKEHHYGRDAAIVGGTGAAGYGAYEAAQAYGDHRSTQPAAAMSEQRYDTAAPGAHAQNPVPAHTEYNLNERNFSRPTGTAAQPALSQELGPKDNSSRNAALGAGAGLAGMTAAGYAGATHGDSSHQPLTSQSAGYASTAQPGVSTLSHSTQDPYVAGGPQLVDPSQVPHEKSHDKRDAALLGTAGAATAAGAGYAYSQRQQPQYDPEDQKKMEKETEKRLHKIEKAQEKEIKHHENDTKVDDGEKKHSILGFLHRDKSKREKTPSPDSTPRRSRDSPRHSKDSPRRSRDYAAPAALAGTAGAAGLAAHDGTSDSGSEHARWKGKNLLHKDPPKGHPAREALEHQRGGEYGGERQHIGVDGPINKPGMISGDRQTEKGVYGAHPYANTTERQDQHHYGRDAAVGGGVLGGGALAGKALAGNNQSTYQSTTAPGTYAAPLAHSQPPYDETNRIQDQHQHHYGRDAALGGGALGGGALAGSALAGNNQSTLPIHQSTTASGAHNVPHTAAPHDSPFTSPQDATFGAKRQHMGIDGPIGDANMISGDRQTSRGTYGAHPITDLNRDKIVIEPHTGLPMNVGRYGEGTGGTDGNATIPGAHHHHGGNVAQRVAPGHADPLHSSTDWDAVKKGDTIY